MKIIEYVLESSKVATDKNIAVCSDLHINQKMPDKKIEEVLQSLDGIKPTHIVIPGDLYDCEGTYFYNNEQITKFIDRATDIADVFYVKGNIEQRSGLLPHKFVNSKNPKFHLLCNGDLEDKCDYFNKDGINISAIKPPLNFYSWSEAERTKYILTSYRKYLEEISKCCGANNFNVLLCHDPIIAKAMLYLKDLSLNNLQEMALNFDLIISGHNHGGIWPEWMRFFFLMLGANMELCYPTYTKGMIDIGCNGEKIIISEGITKFHSDFGSLQILEKYHNGTIENINIRSRRKN